jgi:hypothetical protein
MRGAVEDAPYRQLTHTSAHNLMPQPTLCSASRIRDGILLPANYLGPILTRHLVSDRHVYALAPEGRSILPLSLVTQVVLQERVHYYL